MAKRLLPKLLLGLLLLAAALVLVLFHLQKQGQPYTGARAEIIYGNDVVDIVPLDEDKIFTLRQHPQITFEVKDGAISFQHSDCPDQICVHTGWLNGPGQFAACLPNQTLIWVADEDNPGFVDIMTK